MKVSTTLLLASMGSATAFSGGASKSSPASPLRMADTDGEVEMRRQKVRDYVNGRDTAPAPRATATATTTTGFGVGDSPMMAGPASNPRRRAPRKSEAIPFMNAPVTLDGTMAGDLGFDPLGFASKESLADYREAEIKHARLAMLAAAGWPLSELWDEGIARTLGMEPALDAAGRVPSVLNGGMGKISLTYWLGCLALASAVDVYGSFLMKKKADYVPGDFGFDPLGFYPKDEKGRKNMQLSEIKHGRLAMVAITVFAFMEYFSGTAVIDQAPVFFKPIWQVLSDQQPGYYIPPEAITEAAPYVAPEIAAPAVEAATSAPEIVAPAVMEAATSAATDVPEVAAPAVMEAAASAATEATTAVPPPVAVETLPAVSAEANAPVAAIEEELVAAKSRIVELESKLAQIEALAH